MRSLIAALRTLVLPNGAISGQRIILDGVNGLISIFDSGNKERLRLGGPTGSDRILLFTGDASEIQGADFGTAVLGAGNSRRLSNFIDSPQFSGRSFPTLLLVSESFDGTIKCDIELAADIIKFTGINVLADLKADGRSLPLGIVAAGENVNDVTLSTTAGTYSEIVASSAFNVRAGRTYRVTFSGGDNLLSGGSGFATTDNWQVKFQRDAGGGYGDIAGLTSPAYIARAPLAAAFRYRIPHHIAYYRPGSNASVSWRLVAAKISGASTVTSSVQTNAGASPFEINVEDVGVG